MDVRNLLEQVREGTLSLGQAEEMLKQLPYEDMGFAKLDHHRQLRSGFGEVVFCSGKADGHLVKIYQSFSEKKISVLGTRASEAQYKLVREAVPEVVYDPISRILKLEFVKKQQDGCIAVCTGGTADIPVAEEAAQTAEFFGSRVLRIYDVGVAGIHRLLSNLDQICQANCVVAVAGMEGALGSVLAGLVDRPVIAVPTSVGYGANFGGLSALLSMLNSCANGISVVNIDNGYGAGYISTQINRLALTGSCADNAQPREGSAGIGQPCGGKNGAVQPEEEVLPGPSLALGGNHGGGILADGDTAERKAEGKNNTDEDIIWELECNIDDCSGESMGYVMEQLLENGAKDVYFTPIYMKKNRPAYTLHVICTEKDIEKLEDIIFTGTTTIGIRRAEMRRTILPRRFLEVETSWGKGVVKVCTHKDRVYAYPEFDSVKRICGLSGKDYQEIYHLLMEEALRGEI